MTRTDAKKIEIIGFIVDTRTRNQNDDDGDKYLSSADYAMEAIEAILNDVDPGQNGALRMYLEAVQS